MRISQGDAIEMFGLSTEVLYVCDGKKECGKPSCADLADKGTCHHTADLSHALYDEHYMDEFEQLPAVIKNGEAVVILVEPIRG